MTETMAETLSAQYEEWFGKLQTLSTSRLDIEAWTGRWYDGFSPEEALVAGPDKD